MNNVVLYVYNYLYQQSAEGTTNGQEFVLVLPFITSCLQLEQNCNPLLDFADVRHDVFVKVQSFCVTFVLVPRVFIFVSNIFFVASKK